MSAVSSQLSFRSSRPWKINPRILSIMDSIYAIAFGLGLRTLVDAVSQDFKLKGSLIGLWEGVITLHFLKKMPKSSDPYIAYGVRLFVDLLITESVERLVLVLIWTAFGMVLADVTPAIWDDVGFRRVWRHFRRDLYTIYDRIPIVAFFPPPRTVRFLPPREPSMINPSVTTSQETPIAVIPPSPSEPLKRRVPGYFPGDYSDTDTDLGSIIRSRPSPRTEVNDALGTTHYRLSTMPRPDPAYSMSDLDDGNQSSVALSSVSPTSSNQDEIPDMEEEQALIDIKEADPDPTTPKQMPKYIPMPPTPSDSAARWDLHRDVVEDILHAKPRQEHLPNIPDSMEDGGTSDGWEKVQLDELEDRAPTPPAKDTYVNIPILSPVPVTPVPVSLLNMNTNSSSTNPFDISPLDTFGVSEVPSSTTRRQRESLPPPYVHDDYEDIYYNPPSHDKKPTADDANVNGHVKENNNDEDNDGAKSSRQVEDPSTNPWMYGTSTSDAAAQAQGDAVKNNAEAVEGKLPETKEAEKAREEAARERREAEERETARRAAEEIIRKEEDEKKKAKEKAERRRKEESDAAVRKQKQEEAAAEEKKRKDVDAAKKKKEAEDAEQKRKEEAEKKAEEEAEAKKKKEEEERRREDAEASKKKEEEEEKKKKEEEQAAKREEEEAEKKKEGEKKKKEEEQAAKKRGEEETKKMNEEAEKAAKKKADEKKAEEEAEQKRMAEKAAKKKADEKKAEEEAEQKRMAEEEEMQKEIEKTGKAQEEAHRNPETQANEAENVTTRTEAQKATLDEQQAGALDGQGTRENDDDSKTVLDFEMQHHPQGNEATQETMHDQAPETQQHQQGRAPPTTGAPPDVEEASVVSEATDNQPYKVGERLERMMTLRAQMAELEKRAGELKGQSLDEQSSEVKAVEKTLRKFKRQAERRYTAGQLKLFDYEDKENLCLDGVDPTEIMTSLEELLEQLLSPTSRSITFKLTVGKSKTDVAKQRPIVMRFLVKYNLFKYTKQNPGKKKESSIEIPEEKFAEWLIGYRASMAAKEREDDDGWEQA